MTSASRESSSRSRATCRGLVFCRRRASTKPRATKHKSHGLWTTSSPWRYRTDRRQHGAREQARVLRESCGLVPEALLARPWASTLTRRQPGPKEHPINPLYACFVVVADTLNEERLLLLHKHHRVDASGGASVGCIFARTREGAGSICRCEQTALRQRTGGPRRLGHGTTIHTLLPPARSPRDGRGKRAVATRQSALSTEHRRASTRATTFLVLYGTRFKELRAFAETWPTRGSRRSPTGHAHCTDESGVGAYTITPLSVPGRPEHVPLLLQLGHVRFDQYVSPVRCFWASRPGPSHLHAAPTQRHEGAPRRTRARGGRSRALRRLGAPTATAPWRRRELCEAVRWAGNARPRRPLRPFSSQESSFCWRPFRFPLSSQRFLSSRLWAAFARRRLARLLSLRASFAASLRASRSPTVSLLASCVSSSVLSASTPPFLFDSTRSRPLRFASSAIFSMSSFHQSGRTGQPFRFFTQP